MRKIKRLRAYFCVLALAIAANYAVPMIFDESESVEEDKGIFILNEMEADDVIGLKWVSEDTEMEFVLDSGVWKYKADAQYPANQDKLQALSKAAATLTAVRRLENVSSFSDYGLDEAAFTLTVTWSDGAVTDYALGDETPFGDGWYLTISDEKDIVYIVEDDFTGDYPTDLDDLCVMETIPEIGEVVKMEVGDAFLAEYRDETDIADETIHWFDALSGAPLDTDDVEKLISSAEDLAWEALVNYAADENELLNMNLTDETAIRITLTDEEGGERTILVGSKDENGCCYARLPESTMVYILAGSADDVLLPDAMALRALSVIPVDFEDVASVTYTMNGLTTTVERIETVMEATGEEAEDEVLTEILVNGEAVQSDSAESAWELIADIAAAGYKEDEIKKDVVLTVFVTLENGKTETITFNEESLNNYTITLQDGREMLVSADETDKIIRYVKGI